MLEVMIQIFLGKLIGGLNIKNRVVTVKTDYLDTKMYFHWPMPVKTNAFKHFIKKMNMRYLLVLEKFFLLLGG